MAVTLAGQILQAGQILLALLAGYIVYRTIYNRLFHPLAKFPGPFIASVTDLWKLWILATGTHHLRGIEYHKKYGPVVRVAPNMLAVNDPKLIPTIYHRKVDKSPVYATTILGEETISFSMLKHEEHAARRKQLASPFYFSNLKVAEKDMDTILVTWTNEMRNRYVNTGDRLDFAAWAQWFAYDLVCKLVYGAPLGFITQAKDVDNLIQKFHSMAPMAAVVGSMPWLFQPIMNNRYLKGLVVPRPGDSSGMGQIMAFRDKLLEQRLAEPRTEKRGDFLDHVLDSDMTLEQVRAECLHLMVAASDNTAGFFSSFIRFTLEKPRIYHKLMAEIEDYESKGKMSPVAQYHEISDMPYFTAIHREVLRYNPSAPTLLPRMVSPGGMEVEGRYVPEGVEIGANAYIVHRDKGMFGEDADEFVPERWLVDEERSREMYNHLLSFGWGSRKCMGYNVALMETYKALIHFFRLFKPTLAAEKGEPVWKEQIVGFTKHDDFWVRIQERERTV